MVSNFLSKTLVFATVIGVGSFEPLVAGEKLAQEPLGESGSLTSSASSSSSFNLAEITGEVLAAAIFRNDFAVVVYILDQRPLLVNASITGFDDEGQQAGRTTALHCAISTNNSAFVRLLFERGAAVGIKNAAGSTALGWAVRRNASAAIVDQLLDNGGSQSGVIDYRDLATRRTPLQTAVINANVDVVKLLLDRKATVDRGDENNCSRPLLLAVRLKSAQSAAICMNLTIVLGLSRDDDFFSSCRRNHEADFQEIISVMLRNGANARLVDRCSGESPLDASRKMNDVAIFHLLQSNDTNVANDFSQLPQFDLFKDTRCSGKSRGVIAGYLGNARMLSVEECGVVCEEAPSCYGFNLMLTTSSGARGNGCIIKTWPCKIEPDVQFAFYRKKSMANVSVTARTTRSLEGQTANFTGTTNVMATLMANNYKEAPGSIRNGNIRSLNDQDDIVHREQLLPSSSPQAIRMSNGGVVAMLTSQGSNLASGTSQGPFYSAGMHHRYTTGSQSPSNSRNNDMFYESSSGRQEPQEPSNSNCGRMSWYEWILIGFFIGCGFSTCLVIVFWFNCKQMLMSRNLQNFCPISVNIPGSSVGGSSPPPIKPPDMNFLYQNRNLETANDVNKQETGLKSRLQVAHQMNEQSKLAYSTTWCWASNLPNVIEHDSASDDATTPRVKKTGPTMFLFPSLLGDPVIGSATPPTTNGNTAEDDSSMSLSTASGGAQLIKKQKKRAKRPPGYNNHQSPTKFTISESQEKFEQEQPSSSDSPTKATENSRPSSGTFPPINDALNYANRRSSIKCLHKVDVEWPPSLETANSVTNVNNFIANEEAPSTGNKLVSKTVSEVSSSTSVAPSGKTGNESTWETAAEENKPLSLFRLRPVTKSTDNLRSSTAARKPRVKPKQLGEMISGGRSAVNLTANGKTDSSSGQSDSSPPSSASKHGPRQCWVDSKETPLQPPSANNNS